MTARPLHAVLRALADTGPPATDADLLRRFVATRDDEAFATLVKRHGRLVWAVCRHLTRSDAEADDAFQATFLVLVRNAAGVKDAARLSAWLHGVAYKVCGKSRLAAKRRTTREQATAGRERNGHAIPDSAWDRALSAVHEEVAGLPDSLRVPFVLCCLEGLGQTEAAEQLGWKLGTLSGRLTRAKDAVLAKLSARGLTLGVLASVGLAVVPSDVSAKAVGLGQIGFAVPGSVLQLSSGVIGMSVNKVKLLAAGVLAACGLAISGGAGWVSKAEAYDPTAAASPADRVKQLEAELAKAKAQAARAAEEAKLAEELTARYVEALTESVKKAAADPDKPAKADARLLGEVVKGRKGLTGNPTAVATAKWEYEFVDMAETFDPGNLSLFLQEREKAGWEFLGSSALGKNGGVPMWLFRKSKGGTTTATVYETVPVTKYYTYPKAETTAPAAPNVPSSPPLPPAAPSAPSATPKGVMVPAVAPAQSTPADTAEQIEAEIKRLQEKLEVLKKTKQKGK